MKTNSIIRVTLLLLFNSILIRVFAQNDMSISISYSIKNQDSVKFLLDRFGLEWGLSPAIEFCPVRYPKVPLPYPEIRQPGERDSVVIVQPGTDIFPDNNSIRNVFWIHGLNGNTNSLGAAAYASQFGVPGDPSFPARKIRSYRGGSSSNSNPVQLYSEDFGIPMTSGDLENYAHQNLDPSDKTIYDFIIAHSQGGIVGREWLRNMDQRPELFETYAHGIVTFGTPHGGAEVLNNCRPNLGRDKVPAFMNEACQSLGGAVIIPKMNANFWTSLIPSTYIRNIIGQSCNVLTTSIIPIVLDNYYKATTKDYYVGAPFLEGGHVNGIPVQGLNQYTSKVPVVQFYGVEEQPILWRFMNSTLDIGEIQKNSPNNELFFGYSDDNSLPQKVNSLINEFTVLYELEKENERRLYKRALLSHRLINHRLTKIILIIQSIKRAKDARENKEAYFNGKRWLTNANDYYLTDLIGARTSETGFKCNTVGLVYCRSNEHNPVGSGVPAHEIRIDYNTYPTGNVCSDYPNKPLNYTNYHYSTPNGLNAVGNCSGSIQQVVLSWVTTYSYKDNDGVVLAESAKYPILVDSSVTHSYALMDKTNHDQMKNCTQTKNALTALYSGDLGKFFKTKPR